MEGTCELRFAIIIPVYFLFQGRETSKDDLNEIRDALKNRRKMCVSILNYTRNGKPFWNILAIEVGVVRLDHTHNLLPLQPLFQDRQLVNFVGNIISLPIPEVLIRLGC